MNAVYVSITFFLLALPLNILHAEEEMLNAYIDRMTIEEKIGQLFIIGFSGKVFTPEAIKHVKKINPAGYALYGRNFNDAKDIPELISNIKSFTSNKELPVLFAIDQEGGIVHRVRHELYKPPSAPSLGAANSEKLAWEVGFTVGSMLRSLGINVNLAPVLDVPENVADCPMTMRSFSNDVDNVERLGVSYIKGSQKAGLLSTAKHFPGIGRTKDDSHLMLPRIAWKNQGDRDNDIRPFRSAANAGVDIIMMSHVIAEAGDTKNPASLSSYWMNDVVRKEIGFQGLILVDNIEMKAIEAKTDIPLAAVQAFKAGADLIMISHGKKNQEDTFQAFVDAVERNEISKERLHQSLRRIVKAKLKIMSFEKSEKEQTNTLAAIYKNVAENSIVVLQQKDMTVRPISREASVLYVGYNMGFSNAVKNAFPRAKIFNTPLSEKTKPDDLTFFKNFESIIIDTEHQDAEKIVTLCDNLKIEYVLVLRHPRNIERVIERVQPRRVAIPFENSTIFFQAILDIVRGLKTPKGRLPFAVKFPANYVYSSPVL